MADRTDTQDAQAGEPAGKRRGFLVEIAAIVVGTLAGLGPLAVGLYAVLMEPVMMNILLPRSIRSRMMVCPDGSK